MCRNTCFFRARLSSRNQPGGLLGDLSRIHRAAVVLYGAGMLPCTVSFLLQGILCHKVMARDSELWDNSALVILLEGGLGGNQQKILFHRVFSVVEAGL